MSLQKSKSQSKELFAPIPMRALRDNRLTARHFRVLGSVATYDRLGRNGQGCWAGSKRLADDSGCREYHVSDALSDLRRFGYIASERHPMNRRTKVHRIIYYTSQIREVTQQNTSRLDPEHFPVQNGKALNGQEKGVSNILREHTDKEGGRRDCAEARPAEKASKKAESPESVEAYLSEVESCLSDASSRPTAQYECEKLCEIAENTSLPEPLRSRAAALREIARAAA